METFVKNKMLKHPFDHFARTGLNGRGDQTFATAPTRMLGYPLETNQMVNNIAGETVLATLKIFMDGADAKLIKMGDEILDVETNLRRPVHNVALYKHENNVLSYGVIYV